MTPDRTQGPDKSDASEQRSSARRAWSPPTLTRMVAGLAEFGGSLSADGQSGLS